MALSTTLQATAIATTLIQQTDTNATANTDVMSGAATLYMLDIDNSAVAATTYVKFYDDVAPTVGTTDPDMIIPVAGTVRRQIAMPEGMAFAAGLSFAAVTTAGTAGVVNPTAAVVVRLLAS